MFKPIIVGFPAVIGFTVLLGWVIDSPVLERAGTPFVTMNPATATAMILAGLALTILHYARSSWYRAFGLLLTAGVMTISLMKLSDVALGTDWNVDNRFFAEQMTRGGAKRMAPNAAFDFLLIAGAIGLAETKRTITILASQIMALLCAFVAFLAVVGYTYGTIAFYGIGTFTPMALHAALCFICLSISVLTLNGKDGVMTCITSGGPAGQMARLLLPAAIVIPVGLGALNMIGIRYQLYTIEFGSSISVVADVGVLFILTWIGARWLHIEDLKRQAIEEELRYRASHDRLTGLANRGVLFDMLQQRINIMKRRGGAGFAVFYLDLDGFKQINDQLGHEAGDQLLVDIAKLFLKCTRSTDVVARMGGDEFTILYEEIKNDSDVYTLAQRILNTMPKTFGPGEGCPISVSIGIAFGKPDHNLSEDVLREADHALYKAKTAGKACYKVFPSVLIQSGIA